MQKATGLVRRVDDLGRVVIPKELRRTFRIAEGDPLEIYTDSEGEIILKKYSPMTAVKPLMDNVVATLHNNIGVPVIITDSSGIIVVSSNPSTYIPDSRVSDDLYQLMQGAYRGMDTEDGEPIAFVSIIRHEGDLRGAIFLLLNDGVIYDPNEDDWSEETMALSMMAEMLTRSLVN